MVRDLSSLDLLNFRFDLGGERLLGLWLEGQVLASYC